MSRNEEGSGQLSLSFDIIRQRNPSWSLHMHKATNEKETIFPLE